MVKIFYFNNYIYIFVPYNNQTLKIRLPKDFYSIQYFELITIFFNQTIDKMLF